MLRSACKVTDFDKVWILLMDFRKKKSLISNCTEIRLVSNCTEIRPVGAALIHKDWLTDRHTFRLTKGRAEVKRRLQKPPKMDRRGVRCGLRRLVLFVSRQEQVAGFCEEGNDHSVVIRSGTSLEWLRSCQVINKTLPVWLFSSIH